MKLDCEGAEFEILYSTPKHIFKKIKEIRLEYHNISGENQDISNLTVFLERKGFKMIKFENEHGSFGNAWFVLQ